MRWRLALPVPSLSGGSCIWLLFLPGTPLSLLCLGKQDLVQDGVKKKEHTCLLIPAVALLIFSTPSMQDLVSDGVKKKEHYLKFLPPFFLPVRNVMQEIEVSERGIVQHGWL